MSRRITLVLGLFACVAWAGAAAAQKAPGTPSGDAFFTGKGDQPLALEKYAPGLVATLMLTDEQKQAIADARRDTVDADAVRQAGAAVKGNANATDDQKQVAQNLRETAWAKFREEVAKALTDEQKATVKKIQGAWAEAGAAAREAMGDAAGAVKGDKAKAAEARAKYEEMTREEFAKKLEAVLTAEQREAMAKAAAAQRAAEEASPKGKGAGK